MVTHLIRDCAYATTIWEELKMPQEFFQNEGLKWIKDQAISEQRWRYNLKHADIFLPTIWLLWKERNKLVFEGHRRPPHIVARAAVRTTMEFAQASASRQGQSSTIADNTRWILPPPPFFKLNTDG